MGKQNTPAKKKKHIPKHTVKPQVSKVNKKQLLVFLAVIFALTLIAFYPSVHNEFVSWDDDNYLHENQYVRDTLSSTSEVVSNIFSNIIMANYHPLTMMVYKMEYDVWRLDPFPYHMTNLLLHLINSKHMKRLLKDFQR